MDRMYEIYARRAGPVMGTAEARQAHIAFDVSANGDLDLLNPAEVLLASFAACMLKNVERFSTILPFAYERAEVRVHGSRQESPPRITEVTYTLHLWTDASPQRVDLLHRNLQKFGTVYNTLAASAHVAGQVETHPVGPVTLG